MSARSDCKSHDEQVGATTDDAALKEFVQRSIREVVEQTYSRESSRQDPGTLLAADGDACDAELDGPSIASSDEVSQENRASANVDSGGGGGGERRSGGGSKAATDDVLDVPSSYKGSLRLHKARITALEQDLAVAQAALQDKLASQLELQQEARALRSERDTWSKEKRQMQEQVDKLRAAAEAAAKEAASKDSLLKELSVESRRAEKELKRAEAESKGRDARLNRALEEVAKYRKMLEELRAKQREGLDVPRADFNRLTTENRKLERQRTELMVAFRKQLKLIDILRRQKVHLEAAHMLAFSEEEFARALQGPA